MTLYRMGEFLPARQHLEQSIILYDRQRHFPHPFRYGGADPGVGGLCFAAWTLWQLGYPDQALARGRAALTLAQELSHPFSLAFALNFTAWLHKLRREWAATRLQTRNNSLLLTSIAQAG